jgi:PAS domain S-box-containing protein
VDATIPELNLVDVLERLPEAVALLDHHARFRYVNSAAERLVGKPRPALLGQVAWAVAADPIASALRASFDRILAGDEVLILPSYFAQGRWHEILAHMMRDDIVMFGRDITERLQAEALRRQTEERFQILVDGLQDYAIYMLDLRGRIASWNIGGQRLFGYRPSEILGRDSSILFPPEEVEHARRHLELAVANGYYEEEAGWLVRKDGSRLLASCHFYPLYGPLGEPTGFAVVTRDVTEHHRMLEMIRSNEERLRLATDAAQIGTWDYVIAADEWLPDLRCVTAFGLSADPATKYTHRYMVERIHPADRERADLAWREALRGGEYHAEYRVINAIDGVERWIEGHGHTCPSGGKPVRMLGICRDVTERHRYDEFRRLLPGILAHDLRTPLSTIKIANQMLVKNTALPASATRYADATLRSAAQMARMADQLLSFTQARFGGGLPLERAPTDLGDVCREAVLSAHITSPEAEVYLDVEGDVRGNWDPTRLAEVVANLVGNAIKHGPPGEPIDVAVHGAADDVTLRIHNGGAPIPLELVPLLFDPFRRAERAERAGEREKSFGLGLYISHEIVVAHGGTIDVSSSSEMGTTFTVRLPRGTPAMAPAPMHA